MLASTVVGEAPASAIIRDLLKHDELVKLPPAEPGRCRRWSQMPDVDPKDRAALKAKRKEMRERKQAAASASREQAAKARTPRLSHLDARPTRTCNEPRIDLAPIGPVEPHR